MSLLPQAETEVQAVFVREHEIKVVFVDENYVVVNDSNQFTEVGTADRRNADAVEHRFVRNPGEDQIDFMRRAHTDAGWSVFGDFYDQIDLAERISERSWIRYKREILFPGAGSGA